VLAESKIREVYILGRRGPAQAAFTNPELLELGELTDADVVVEPFALDPHSKRSIEGEGDLTPRKNVEFLTEYSQREPTGKPKRVVLKFLVSPVAIRGEGKVEQLEIVHNELHHGDDGSLRARPTDEHETLDVGVVFRSIGYRGVALPGVPFDEWHGTIPNQEGRVIDPQEQHRLPGLYAVGWIKRGPSGVIGTNKRDAQETVDRLMEDLDSGHLMAPGDPSREALEALVAERKPDHVPYAGWDAIDAAEKGAGEPHGRPRVKLCTFDELLEAARAKQAA
jgi:ferredoxin--NADP+ reductase